MENWYALDHVRTLAEAAGLAVVTNDVERDGVDLTLRRPGRALPLIDVLVRAWDDGTRHGDAHVIELPEPLFNRVAGANYTAPRYVLAWRFPAGLSPDAPTDVHDVETRDLGVYGSLANLPPIEHPDPIRNRAVHLPLANVLTGRSLRNLVLTAFA